MADNFDMIPHEAEAEIDELVARRDQIDLLRTALGAIEARTQAAGQAVKFSKLDPLAANIFRLLNDAIAARDPAQAMLSDVDSCSTCHPDAAAQWFKTSGVDHVRSLDGTVLVPAAAAHGCFLEFSSRV